MLSPYYCLQPIQKSPYRFLPVDGDGFQLENGAQLSRVGLAYESWGRLSSDRQNGILLLHGFTGNSHASSYGQGDKNRSPGWWEGLIGPGLPLDTNRYFVVCPNVLGGCNGSTGPSSFAPDGRPYGSRFPRLTIRDLVAVEQAWADALGIQRWYAVVGASLGGMRGLEWAITAPDRLQRLLLIATTPVCSPINTVLHRAQISAIELDPAFAGGDYYSTDCMPLRGLRLARSIAQVAYSCGPGRSLVPVSESRGDSQVDPGEEAISFARRFDANSYRVLTEAMNSHDIGRGRGGVVAALQQINVPTMVISIQSDRLFPPSDQELIARHISRANLFAIDSAMGHDGFLHDLPALDPFLRLAMQ